MLERDAPFVFDGLVRAGQPFIFFSAACGVGCLTLIASGITRGARALAIGAVVAVLAGWGVAQYPYLLPTSLTIADGSGRARNAALGPDSYSLIAVVTVVPALALLFVLDQRGRLEEKSTRRRPVAVPDQVKAPDLRPDWWERAPSR